MEQALIDTMFELPNQANVDKVVVDETVIDDNKPPLLVYRESAKQA
jgi:ATP-dependent Clp protease ATP-binding subunit ClpX